MKLGEANARGVRVLVPCLVLTLAAAGRAEEGKELFTREWIPGDERSHGGDGLGPVFNDTSCVACHNQGGVGGAGPAARNVRIITAFSNRPEPQLHPLSSGLVGTMVNVLTGISMHQAKMRAPEVQDASAPDPEARKQEARKQREKLAEVHPGFLTAPSVVLHRFGTDDGYEKWRLKTVGFHMISFGGHSGGSETRAQLQQEVQFGSISSFPNQDGPFAFVPSERNPTALFGAGMIGGIPDEVLVAVAAQQKGESGKVSGRVARLKDGRMGRFGWKAQEATLEAFVNTACAIELGLEVPGAAQASLPYRPEAPPGLDLTGPECSSLTSYIASLPAPTERRPATAQETLLLAEGKESFAEIGCATCHAPRLGDVEGIYSDLLLHDMGSDLADSGNYGSAPRNVTDEEQLDEPIPSLQGQHVTRFTSGEEEKDGKPIIGARRQEWRTPPLWGVRDSAPYLHDGRADTLEQAIALHGGEAEPSAKEYFDLPREKRLSVLALLRSLVAPE